MKTTIRSLRLAIDRTEAKNNRLSKKKVVQFAENQKEEEMLAEQKEFLYDMKTELEDVRTLLSLFEKIEVADLTDNELENIIQVAENKQVTAEKERHSRKKAAERKEDDDE